MTAFWTAIAAVLIFCVLIFVHELGHFISAKLLGIRVHEFAIGMGPKLFGRQKGETLYSVRVLPIGGYCALEGEDKSSDDERSLSNKPAWVKLIVLVAGSFMNLLLGLVLLLCVYGSSEQVAVPQVTVVAAGSIAETAGIMPGDEIITFDGDRIHIVSDLHWAISRIKGETAEVTVRRNGEKMNLSLLLGKREENAPLGLQLAVQKNNVLLTMKNGFYTTVFYAKMVIVTLFDLIRGDVGIGSMSGPIGIVSVIGDAVEETAKTGLAGFLSLLQLATLLTVNLGVFNLLPIPALDGGRIFFVLIEMIRRKPLPPEKEGLVHMIGFAILILLSLFIAYMDVLRLI